MSIIIVQYTNFQDVIVLLTTNQEVETVVSLLIVLLCLASHVKLCKKKVGHYSITEKNKEWLSLMLCNMLKRNTEDFN